MGSDIVPTMLTPGEFVVNRASAQRYSSILPDINSGTFGGMPSGFMVQQMQMPPRQPMPQLDFSGIFGIMGDIRNGISSLSNNFVPPMPSIPKPQISSLGQRNMQPPKPPQIKSGGFGPRNIEKPKPTAIKPPGLGSRNIEGPKIPRLKPSTYSTAQIKPVPQASRNITNTSNRTVNPVYNYSVSVNANGSNLNANDVASRVMNQIRNLEGQRVRTQR